MRTAATSRAQRLAARALTGMPGHLVGGLLDWVQFTGLALARGLRRRARRRFASTRP